MIDDFLDVDGTTKVGEVVNCFHFVVVDENICGQLMFTCQQLLVFSSLITSHKPSAYLPTDSTRHCRPWVVSERPAMSLEKSRSDKRSTLTQVIRSLPQSHDPVDGHSEEKGEKNASLSDTSNHMEPVTVAIFCFYTTS